MKLSGWMEAQLDVYLSRRLAALVKGETSIGEARTEIKQLVKMALADDPSFFGIIEPVDD